MRQCRRLPERRKKWTRRFRNSLGPHWQKQKKERYWWSIGLEGEVEELEVGGPWALTESNSVDPEEEMNHQPDGEKVAVEEEKIWEN